LSLTSLWFYVLVAVLLAVYYITPGKARWVVLLIASWGFYLLAASQYAPYLAATTFSTWLAGRLMGREQVRLDAQLADDGERKVLQAASRKRKARISAGAILLNVAVLATVKYGGFAASNLNVLLDAIGRDWRVPVPELLIPLGISFYTFQSLSYVIDVYRGKIESQPNLARYALFVGFFPQMVQGPIGRYDALAPQLLAANRFDFERIKDGLGLMLWGFFKKLVIADRGALIVANILSNGDTYQGLYVPLAMVLTALQVYCDFSGGIDIVTGVAEMFGIQLATNFRRPYLAQSVPEYWRRWHITLGAWMRDYVYYPLALWPPLARAGRWLRRAGLKRLGVLLPAMTAELVVFAVIGIWHGAEWKWLVYGLYYAILIILGLVLGPYATKVGNALGLRDERWSTKALRITAVFALACMGRYITRADNLSHTWELLLRTKAAWNPWILTDGSLWTLAGSNNETLVLLAALGLLGVVSVLQERGFALRERIAAGGRAAQWSVIIVAIVVVVLFGVYGPDYPSVFVYELF